MAFQDCLMISAGQKDLIKEFDRLCGTSLSEQKSSINQMIDEATGKEQDDITKFINFVYRYIWLTHKR